MIQSGSKLPTLAVSTYPTAAILGASILALAALLLLRVVGEARSQPLGANPSAPVIRGEKKFERKDEQENYHFVERSS